MNPSGAWQSALSFDLRSNQTTWIELCQITEPFAWHANVYTPSNRISFVALPGMVLKCGIYGNGDPLRFTVTYVEPDEDAELGKWEVILTRPDGTESKVKVVHQ